MNPREYEIMYAVEDRHWWYVALRAMLDLFWRKHVTMRNAESASRDLKVLDAGCGTGGTLSRLAPRGTPFGIDVSVDAVRLCRARGQTRTAVGSTNALPCAPETFDAVISFDVLYHKGVPDKKAALREMHRALKPGGLLFLNLPAYQWLYSSHDVAIHTDHRFTRSEVLGLLRACSFEPLDATYWNTLLLPPIVLTRLWRRMMSPPDSDLARGSGIPNQLFARILAVERALVRVVPLPFGLSIFAVSRKT